MKYQLYLRSMTHTDPARRPRTRCRHQFQLKQKRKCLSAKSWLLTLNQVQSIRPYWAMATAPPLPPLTWEKNSHVFLNPSTAQYRATIQSPLGGSYRMQSRGVPYHHVNNDGLRLRPRRP